MNRLWRLSTRLNHSLRTPLAGFEAPKFAIDQPSPFYAETNEVKGMRVVARPHVHGKYCTVGVLVPTGSRQSHRHPPGLLHLIERFAYGPTKVTFDSRSSLQQFLDTNGGHCDALADRESVLYALSIPRDALDQGVSLLMECAFQPVITPETVREGLENVLTDLTYMKYEQVREKEVIELTCQAGYRNNSLGFPREMPEDALLTSLDQNGVANWMDSMKSYRRAYFNPVNTCVVGIGCTSDEMARAVELAAPAFDTETIDYVPGEAEQQMVSQWTGGIVTRNEEAANRFTFSQDGESTYWSVSWEAPNYNQHQRYAAHVLRILLGGGSAFSSGGPGKGIKSILYADIMCGHLFGSRFIDLKALYKEFCDSGIFTIYGRIASGADVDNLKIGFLVAYEVMEKIRNGRFTDEQLDRAKRQLCSELLRQMESKASPGFTSFS